MSAPKKLPECFWLTRDKIFGELSSRVDVWAVEPVRTDIGAESVTWLAPEDKDVDTEDTCLGDWALWEAKREVRVVPETDRECIRVGEPVVISERERMAS